MISQKEKVSVIIPVYNVARKLNKGLSSLLYQTYTDIELILINDGSTDNSIEILQFFANKDERFKLIQKENSGASETRNFGLDIATGKYVMFMDADDWYESNMIEKMVSWISNDDELDSVCCARFFERQQKDGTFVTLSEKTMNLPCDNYITDNIPEYIARLEASRRFPYLWDKIYRREIIERNHIRFEKQFITGQDNDFNMKYFRYIRKGMISNHCLYHYVKDGVGSLCARYKKGLYGIVKELNQRKYDLFSEYRMFDNQEYLTIYANSYISYLHTCIPNMYRINANLSLREKRQLIKEIFKDTNIKKYLPLYHANDKIEKIFKFILRFRSSWFAVIVYSFLFYIKNHSEKFYKIIR